MKTFSELRKINVNDFTEKKGQLTYLSWTWAVDTLLQNDESATWEFPEPKVFNDTMMVFCNVTAMGKTMKMQLPVMDNRNNAITNPDARKISDATMRCLAKCIACFGIGLYIYAGEDLPSVENTRLSVQEWIDAIEIAPSPEALKATFAKAYGEYKSSSEDASKIKAAYDNMKTIFSERAVEQKGEQDAN
ncbi:Single-strand annealing protein SAK3 [uncultured Caudovirales phage]|uniref:Single-strand annealing protein SAK3 n=1 Tax=uncultured Caudovirales phage TaxID=2100421 RepID=A0A6J5TB24_9CAUD|nr:Single-strand annealing protein SAK3 [uncultured Caudovirales phage]CAB4242061.1 Single-strand annealing protein SAK3 [uncultured Caudovirales phage]